LVAVAVATEFLAPSAFFARFPYQQLLDPIQQAIAPIGESLGTFIDRVEVLSRFGLQGSRARVLLENELFYLFDFH
jgi:hypothetical protein